MSSDSGEDAVASATAGGGGANKTDQWKPDWYVWDSLKMVATPTGEDITAVYMDLKAKPRVQRA